MIKNDLPYLTAFTSLIGLAVPYAVLGAGFQVQEQSVKGLGNAFAGGSAIAEDGSTVMSNPAGLVRLPAQTEFGVHIISPNTEFKDRNSSNGIGGPTTGKLSDDGGAIAAVPNFYYTRPINDKLSFGFGISTLYGLATEYDRNWIGRYHAVKSELITININPALAYKVDEHLSLGFGLSAQYADATLSNALDFGTLGYLDGIPEATPSTPALDGFSELTGDDWGFGFNLGLLYQISPSTRFGLAYRSQIDHSLEGNNTLTIPDFAIPLAGPSRSRGGSADITTPATLSLSAYHELDHRWAVMADITWTDWSQFDELRIKFSSDPFNPDPNPSVQPENWQDVYRYSIGVNYRHSPQWLLRAGIAYDESPVPGADYRTPRIPDNDRLWLSLGASYTISQNFSLDFAYVHIFVDDTPIRDTEVSTGGLAGVPVGNTLDGEYEASVDLAAIQLQWTF